MSFAFSRFLIYFSAVARAGSIRKASERLHVAASAINKQILQVEEALGTPLFERLPSGLRPTAAGEILIYEARRWNQDFDRVLGQIDDLKGLRRGYVRIASIGALSEGFLPRTISSMVFDYPGIECTLNVCDNLDVMTAVIDGEADFGLMLDPLSSRHVRVQTHIEVPLGFVARPGHDLPKATALRFSACDGLPVIAPAAPLSIHEQWQALIASSSITPKVAAWSDNVQMIKSLAREGVGVAVLSRLDVMEDLERGDLRFIPLIDKVIKPLQLALVVAPARQLSQSANLCLGLVEDEFQKLF